MRFGEGLAALRATKAAETVAVFPETAARYLAFTASY